ncbi:MAG: hypothetical protein ABI573_02820 [Chloroflexota bacterium]
MHDRRLDPNLPLPPAPDPWVGSEMPSPRSGVPYHLTEMIEAEPALAERVLTRLAGPGPALDLAIAIRAAAGAGRPIIVVGCGTSEHGAVAVAEILRDAHRAIGLPSELGVGGSPIAAQAFEGGLEPALGGPGAVVIGVSHEGGTKATYRAMSAARETGSTVAMITAAAGSPGGVFADIAVATEEMDQSWCHTVGYLSPILVGIAVAGHLTGASVVPADARNLLGAGLAAGTTAALAGMAERLSGRQHLVMIGSGIDRIAARELTLKVEEGAQIPSSMRDLETMLHGHLAGTGADTGLVLILADAAARGPRTARALGLLRACRELGISVGLIGSAVVAGEIDVDLTPAGRALIPDEAGFDGAAAALIGTAIPLQRLAEQLAIQRGVNPDAIRRDDPRYLAAVDAAG